MKTDIHRLAADGIDREIRLDIFPMAAVEAVEGYDLPRDLYHDGGWRIEGLLDGVPVGTRFYSGLLGSAYWGQADSSEVAREFLAAAKT